MSEGHFYSPWQYWGHRNSRHLKKAEEQGERREDGKKKKKKRKKEKVPRNKLTPCKVCSRLIPSTWLPRVRAQPNGPAQPAAIQQHATVFPADVLSPVFCLAETIVSSTHQSPYRTWLVVPCRYLLDCITFTPPSIELRADSLFPRGRGRGDSARATLARESSRFHLCMNSSRWLHSVAVCTYHTYMPPPESCT
jgi:hypothetical protein